MATVIPTNQYFILMAFSNNGWYFFVANSSFYLK
jgi:hypothetical protein